MLYSFEIKKTLNWVKNGGSQCWPLLLKMLVVWLSSWTDGFNSVLVTDHSKFIDQKFWLHLLHAWVGWVMQKILKADNQAISIWRRSAMAAYIFIYFYQHLWIIEIKPKLNESQALFLNHPSWQLGKEVTGTDGTEQASMAVLFSVISLYVHSQSQISAWA